MPLQNRVTAFGDLVASPARGRLTGNRGCLVDSAGRLGRARWRSKAWIACALAWKDVRRTPMRPGTWTELFFLDEATAFAAGHRPCALCRRLDYDRYRAAWALGHDRPARGVPRARAMDDALHEARIDPHTRTQRRSPTRLGALPDGALVARAGEPGEALLWWAGALRRWSLAGYGPTLGADPDETVEALTPAPTLAAFAGGYRPGVHASAG